MSLSIFKKFIKKENLIDSGKLALQFEKLPKMKEYNMGGGVEPKPDLRLRKSSSFKHWSLVTCLSNGLSL